MRQKRVLLTVTDKKAVKGSHTSLLSLSYREAKNMTEGQQGVTLGVPF